MLILAAYVARRVRRAEPGVKGASGILPRRATARAVGLATALLTLAAVHTSGGGTVSALVIGLANAVFFGTLTDRLMAFCQQKAAQR